MRVLVLTHPESDYGASFLFNGLCRVLGVDHVFDYPIKPTYHGKDDKEYPRPWCNDGPGNTGRYDWLREGVDNGCPVHGLRTPHDVRYFLKDGFFDFVILESWRWTVQRSWNELCEDIRIGGAKVILHDGEDYHSFNREALETVRPDFYLKRELLKNYDFSNQSGPVVLPFPFSAPDQIVEWADSQPPAAIERDIACLLGLSWEPRLELANELRKGIDAGEFTGYVATNADSDRNNPQNLLGFWEYLELLRTSRFGVSMRGFGFDSCRLTETAVLTGLLTDELDIQYPFPFVHSETCIEYYTPRHARIAAESIGKYAPDVQQEIRSAGIKWARTHHTNSARVKWLLERVVD